LGFTTAFNVARAPDTEVAADVCAVGLTPEIVNERGTSAAAENIPFTPRDATTEQVPGETYVRVDPDTVQTDVVDEENETAPPDEDEAESVRVPEASASSVRDANVTVWMRKGRVETALATFEVAVTPLPRRPALLLPQHQIVDADAAHAKSEPVVTTWADATVPTACGPLLADVPESPLPTWPLVLSPKHATVPVVRSRQE
jgi:hypothetical protein